MSESTYKVKSGDTLNEIAARYNVDPRELARTNGIVNPNIIYVGQNLVVPEQKPAVSLATYTSKQEPGSFGSQNSTHYTDQLKSEPDFCAADPIDICSPCAVTKTPPCCVTELHVGCEHKKRSFRLEVPNAATQRNGRYVIQLLADEKDVDTVSINLVGGPCAKGKPTGKGANTKITGAGDAMNKVPSISLNGPNTALRALAPFNADLKSPSSRTDIDLVTFMRTSIPPGAEYTTYRGTVNCCDGGSEFLFDIEVFPAVEWKGQVSIGYKFGMKSEVVEYSNASAKKPEEPLLTKRANLYNMKDQGTFSITGEISGSYGGQTFQVALPTFEQEGVASTGRGATAFSGFKYFFEKLLPRLWVFLSNELVKIEPVWPNVTFGGNVKLVESVDDYDVHCEGSVFLKCDPLIGLNGSTDILDWLILAAGSILGSPATGRFLLKIKTKAEEGVGKGVFGGKAKLAIEFTATGKVSGGLEWKFRPGKDECNGEIKASVELKLEGVAEIEVRVFIFSAGAAASISGVSGFSGSLMAQMYGKEPGFSGQLTFAGLVIKAIAYASVGGSSLGKGEPGGSTPMPGKGKLNVETVRVKDEQSLFDPIELIPPAQFPKEDSGKGTSVKEGA